MVTARRAIIIPALVLALVAAGCSTVTGTGDPSTAATVNGEAIALSAVEAQMDLARAGALEEDLEPDQLAALQADILQYLVRLRLLEQGATDLGIEFTDADLEQARDDLAVQFGGQEMLELQLESQGLEIADLDQQLKSQTLEVRINEVLSERIDVADADIEEAYDRQFGPRPTVRHILLETEEEAEDVIAEIEAGADFNELAVERSTDPSALDNAGELGSLQRGQTVPEFEDAAFDADEGDLVGPVETQFGFHVLEVTEYAAAGDAPALAEVEDQLRAEVAAQQGGQAAFLEWITDIAAEADVDINPRFGTWDAENLAVVPSSALDSEG